MKKQQYVWGIWQDAFCKFGYDDGDGEVLTPQVATALEQTGYEVSYGQWGCHNLLIYSILSQGIELIPKAYIGYQKPEIYLPSRAVIVLDKAFPKEHALSPTIITVDQEPD